MFGISTYLEYSQNWRGDQRMVARLQYAAAREITVAVKLVLGNTLHGVVIDCNYASLLPHAQAAATAAPISFGNNYGLTVFDLRHVEACNHLYLPDDRFSPDLKAVLTA